MMKIKQIYVIILLGLTFLIAGCGNKADLEAKAMEQRIRELVPIGMNMDEAIEILRADGISITDKYYGSIARNYWLADIIVRKKFTFLDSVKMTIHKGKINKMIVSIEANSDGEITSIE